MVFPLLAPAVAAEIVTQPIEGVLVGFQPGPPRLSQRRLRDLLKTIVVRKLQRGHPLLECSEKCHFHSAVSSAIFLLWISILHQGVLPSGFRPRDLNSQLFCISLAWRRIYRT
jgi:hypothetical protein